MNILNLTPYETKRLFAVGSNLQGAVSTGRFFDEDDVQMAKDGTFILTLAARIAPALTVGSIVLTEEGGEAEVRAIFTGSDYNEFAVFDFGNGECHVWALGLNDYEVVA